MSNPLHNAGGAGGHRGSLTGSNGSGTSSTNPLSMSDGDLAVAAMEAERAAAQNSALLRAHAAQHAALIARHQQEAAIRQASMEANWLGATAAAAASAQSQQQQMAAAETAVANAQQAQAAQAAQRRASDVSDSAAGTGASGSASENIIPIGFFRDPRGNAWAASLQHPSQASLLMRLQQQQRVAAASGTDGDAPLANVYQHAARQAILAAQQQQQRAVHTQARHHQAMVNMQQQQSANKSNKTNANNQHKEIIEIDSDDDDEEEDEAPQVDLGDEDDEDEDKYVVAPRTTPHGATTGVASSNHHGMLTADQIYANQQQQLLRRQQQQHVAARKDAQMRAAAHKNERKIALVAAAAAAKDQQRKSTTGQQQQPSLAVTARKRALQMQSGRAAGTGGFTSAGAAAQALNKKRRVDAAMQASASAAPAGQPPGDYDTMMRERHERARKQAMKGNVEAAAKLDASPAMAIPITAAAADEAEQAAAGASPINPASNRSLVGPFVHKWLSNSGMSLVDKDRQLREVINKVLMAATGYSMESAPASLPFPPAEIDLDMDQLEELALDLVHERHQAIGEAIRRAYSEIKSRHDELIIHRQQRSEERNQHRREVAMLTLRHKNSVRDVQRQHEQQMLAMQSKMREMEQNVKDAKEMASKAKETQAKSLETMMKASILSLRMIRKKEKQPSGDVGDAEGELQ